MWDGIVGIFALGWGAYSVIDALRTPGGHLGQLAFGVLFIAGGAFYLARSLRRKRDDTPQ